MLIFASEFCDYMATLLENALLFAKKAHEGQKRDNGDPYFVHPKRVVAILQDELGITDEIVLASAALHDTMEDCGVTEEEIASRFGPEVAHNVFLLTKSKETHHNPVLVKAYLDRIKASSKEVQLIKLADRLDNIRDLKQCPDRKKVERYTKETREIFLPWAEKMDEKLRSLYSKALASLL